MGILLVYDVTDEASFNNIRNGVRNIEQHASDGVCRLLVGNKSDLSHRRAVSVEEGQEFARENGLLFLETSAKTSLNVDEAFVDTAKQIFDKVKQGTVDATNDSYGVKIGQGQGAAPATTSSCC